MINNPIKIVVENVIASDCSYCIEIDTIRNGDYKRESFSVPVGLGKNMRKLAKHIMTVVNEEFII